MKICGLIGGISWTSTIEYYRSINLAIGKHMGSLNSSKIILISLNLQEFELLLRNNKIDEVKNMIGKEGLKLFKLGVDFIVICSNTGHIGVDVILEKIMNYDKSVINFPIVHIGDCLGMEIRKRLPQCNKVAILSTKYTVKMNHIAERLLKYNINSIYPNTEEQDIIQDVIEKELSVGIFNNEHSKELFLNIIVRLTNDSNIEGVILGCTEIPLLIKEKEYKGLIIFDSTRIHIEYIINYQLDL